MSHEEVLMIFFGKSLQVSVAGFRLCSPRKTALDKLFPAPLASYQSLITTHGL